MGRCLLLLWILLTPTRTHDGARFVVRPIPQYQILPICTPHSTGVASWYGPGFHGRRMSNGETYDQDGMTAAHRKMPLGTVIRVTRKGKSIYLRVTDRGPYIKGRIIDLSREAARQLHMEKLGLSRVKIDVCGQGGTTSPRSDLPTSREGAQAHVSAR